MGYLTGVPGWANSGDLPPQPTVAAIHHTNGVIDRWTEDPQSVGRPRSITTTSGPSLLWTTGAFEYDGAGNILAMGPTQSGATDRYLSTPPVDERCLSGHFHGVGDTGADTTRP